MSAPAVEAPRAGGAGLEQVACALCGSERASLHLEGRDVDFGGRQRYRILRCQSCGLHYLSPRPDRQHIGRHYPDAYYTHHLIEPRRAARIYRRPLALFRRWAPAGPVLDIGAGDGAFLDQLRRAGRRDLQGLEADDRARRLASEARGLDLLPGRFPEARIDREDFAAVSLLETIEHLHAPVEGLRHLRDLLTPGGILILSTPNIQGLEFRLLRGRSISLQLPRHLYFFSPDSLEKACRAAGLRPLHLETGGDSSGLTRSLWLALRRGADRSPAPEPAPAPEPVAVFHARSWRRTAHELASLALRPLDWLLARMGLGPTLYLVAERPIEEDPSLPPQSEHSLRDGEDPTLEQGRA